ncbi:MAG: LysR family transcriptional regulator, partial [Comamonadaceae bacterium]
MQRLPSLSAVKAFDAAARHLSFTAAAIELHVTHGAVSRQVAALEEELQAPLFVRGARGLRLTAAGAQLARGVGTAFDTLRAAVSQVRQDAPASALRVSVPPTLAMWWLIPRLSALHRDHPRLQLDVSTSTDPVDFDGGAYDAAIRRIGRAPKDLAVQAFLDARPVPVCSPAYQKQHRLRTPAQLARATLILTRSEPQAWPAWIRANRLARDASSPTLVFEQLYFALQAAIDSLGVALAPAALVEAEIARGRLLALARPEGPVTPSYALLSPRLSPRRDAIRTLGDW